MIERKFTLMARRHFVRLTIYNIRAAKRGEYPCNDVEAYVKSERAFIPLARSGARDHSFTFRQMAAYFQTGEMVALLS